MARKRTRRAGSPSGKGSQHDATKPHFKKLIVSHSDTSREHVTNTRQRLLQVASDLRRDPSLSFTEAARNRGVDRDSRHNYVTKLFYTDASGRIRARKSDNYSEVLHIPSTKPGVELKIRTKGSAERSLVGQWQAAVNAAASGDFSKINVFPKGQFVGGTRLATGTFEVQKIVEAMEAEGEKSQGLYRARVVRG